MTEMTFHKYKDIFLHLFFVFKPKPTLCLDFVLVNPDTTLLSLFGDKAIVHNVYSKYYKKPPVIRPPCAECVTDLTEINQ